LITLIVPALAARRDRPTMPHTIFGLDPLVVASTLLVLTYGAIVTDRINRAVVACRSSSRLSR
jgi:hypothetical protein